MVGEPKEFLHLLVNRFEITIKLLHLATAEWVILKSFFGSLFPGQLVCIEAFTVTLLEPNIQEFIIGQFAVGAFLVEFFQRFNLLMRCILVNLELIGQLADDKAVLLCVCAFVIEPFQKLRGIGEIFLLKRDLSIAIPTSDPLAGVCR